MKYKKKLSCKLSWKTYHCSRAKREPTWRTASTTLHMVHTPPSFTERPPIQAVATVRKSAPCDPQHPAPAPCRNLHLVRVISHNDLGPVGLQNSLYRHPEAGLVCTITNPVLAQSNFILERSTLSNGSGICSDFHVCSRGSVQLS